MRPENRNLGYLWDMLESAAAIAGKLKDVELPQYLANEDLRLLAERRIEIIGEAARRLSEPFRLAHPEIPWRLIIGMRNVLVHEYDEIDHERVWRLVKEEMPLLIEKIRALLRPQLEDRVP